ncbi:MAG: NADH-quinone oxidoreductase subunit NuoE family protein [Armatimonadota bacterium]
MNDRTGAKCEAVGLPSETDILAELDRLGVTSESNLIALLQDVQERFSFLPRFALEEISCRTGIPLSRVYGVVSFYTQFYTEPRGRHTIRCCSGTACHVKDAPRVLDSIERVLGIEEGQSTPDLRFYLETVACLGTCFLAPVMMIDNEYFGELTPERVEKVLSNYGGH